VSEGGILVNIIERIQKRPRPLLEFIRALLARIRGPTAGLSFKEMALYSGQLSAALREKLAPYNMETSRLGQMKVLLIENGLYLIPDRAGRFTIRWGFENWIDGRRLGGNYDMYTQYIDVTSDQVGKEIYVKLRDQWTETHRPEYDAYTYFEADDWVGLGLADGAWRTLEHRTRATITSPSGASVTVSATWSDRIRAWVTLSARLAFKESKYT